MQLRNFLDYVNVKIPGQKKSIKFPLNLKGYRYHLAEYDANKLIHDRFELEYKPLNHFLAFWPGH